MPGEPVSCPHCGHGLGPGQPPARCPACGGPLGEEWLDAPAGAVPPPEAPQDSVPSPDAAAPEGEPAEPWLEEDPDAEPPPEPEPWESIPPVEPAQEAPSRYEWPPDSAGLPRPSHAAPRWLAPLLAGAAAFAVAGLLALGLWLLLDSDGDGVPSWDELQSGTVPWNGDSDGDTLADGWEASRGTDPLAPDSDADGLDDRLDLVAGADPLRPDSDGDGLGDFDEAGLPVTDCDGDGLPGVAESDDDADGRKDSGEQLAARCEDDGDGDGLLDGEEGNPACVFRVDCDGDGLPDPEEATSGSGFDALDADSFGVGMSDAVSWAFEEAGQPPSPDGDGDGIPDAWETSQGLIFWGGLRPEAGRRDLLVEFVRMQGPDSGRYEDLDFTPAYEALEETLLDEGGVTLSWTETLLETAEEPRPPILPSLVESYYADLLRRAGHSANPYVTTVVLNPQHDQSIVLHSGIAPIRGMLAAVDYGSHVDVHFRGGGERITLRPVVESVILGGQTEVIEDMGFDDGYPTVGGLVALRDEDDGFYLAWRPHWFRTPPTYYFDEPRADNSTELRLRRDGAEVADGELAATLLHELGHTLGLCHSHEPACNAEFSAADRRDQARSSMSYDARRSTVHLLDSEWQRALVYLACPPQEALTLLAEGAGEEEILEAKYGYTLEEAEAVDFRACGHLASLERTIAFGEPAATAYAQPLGDAEPDLSGGGMEGTWWFAGVATAVALAVAVGAGLWWARWRMTATV